MQVARGWEDAAVAQTSCWPWARARNICRLKKAPCCDCKVLWASGLVWTHDSVSCVIFKGNVTRWTCFSSSSSFWLKENRFLSHKRFPVSIQMVSYWYRRARNSDNKREAPLWGSKQNVHCVRMSYKWYLICVIVFWGEMSLYSSYIFFCCRHWTQFRCNSVR